MTNYFFVHTATQLVIAQHIVQSYYTHDNNYLVLGNTGSNKESIDGILSMLCINEIWSGKSNIGDLNDYIPGLGSLKNWQKTRSYLNSFKDVSKSAFFFGDIGHIGYLNFAKHFEKQKGNINFFEEGISHYSKRLLRSKDGHVAVLLIKRIAHFILSHLFFGNGGVGIYVFNNKRVELNIKIEKRYNLLDRRDWDHYDVRINFNDIFNEGHTIHMIHTNLEKLGNEPCVLFLTSTLRNYAKHPKLQELEFIEMLVKNIEFPLVYKFHPKDDVDFRKAISEECTNRGYNVFFIFNDIPAELLFGSLNIVGVNSYGSSAHLYFLSSFTDEDVLSHHVYELAEKYTPKDELSRFDWLLKYYNSWNTILESFNIGK